MNSRFSERPYLRKLSGRLWKRASDVNFWPPYMRTHMHAQKHIHRPPNSTPLHTPKGLWYISSRNLELVCQRKDPLVTYEWSACGLWFTRAVKYTAYFKYLTLRKNIKCHANNFYTCGILKW